jgi:hypothetical protein
MTLIELARKLRPLIEKAAQSLSDADSLEAVQLFEHWQPGEDYPADKKLQYNGELWKVLQAHTSQANWTPDTAVSLYVRVYDPAIEYPDWRQPIGAQDAYRLGDKVSHNGQHWHSTIDYNTYEPGVYGWVQD